ncbi:MAG: hypothetical protein PHV32_13130 [Eubacteriales bacterium]|nr:hypothetical protein [Eubacteriales bacterium]
MKVLIERNGRKMWLSMPCSDTEMYEKLNSIGIHDPTDTEFHIEDISSGITEFSVLNDSYINLDHINLLARYIDGMVGSEVEQFRAALCYTRGTSIQSIIDISQNLGNYTLIGNDTSLEQAGLQHYLDIHTCISMEEKSKLDLAAVARGLIASSKGYKTPYGMVFDNNLEIDRVFNGTNIPLYYDREFALCYEVHSDNGTEFLLMPCDEICFAKAAHRLGVSDISECEMTLSCCNIEDIRFTEFLKAHADASAFDLNMLAFAVSGFHSYDVDKLLAVYEYAQAAESNIGDKINAMCRIAENLDSFEYAPEAESDESLGRYLIRESGRYNYDPELDDYYDYGGFGADKLDNQDGRFMSTGYVGIKDDIQLYEIFEQDSHQMGGIE